MNKQSNSLNIPNKNRSGFMAKRSLSVCIIFTSFTLGCNSLPKRTDEIQAHLSKAGDSVGKFASNLFKPAKKQKGQTDTLAKNSNRRVKQVKLDTVIYEDAGKINTTTLIWPIKKIDISSAFGPRGGRHHGGIDLAAAAGTQIYATAAGKVIYSGRYSWFFDYGRLVKIQHSPGFETVYAHNKELFVKAGEFVQQGQLIASVGNSGGAHGNHLHFEVIIDGTKVNPEIYLPKLPEKRLETTSVGLDRLNCADRSRRTVNASRRGS